MPWMCVWECVWGGGTMAPIGSVFCFLFSVFVCV